MYSTKNKQEENLFTSVQVKCLTMFHKSQLVTYVLTFMYLGLLEAVRYHNNIITAGPDNRLLDYAARTDKH